MYGKAMACSGGIIFGAAQKLDEQHHFIPEYEVSKKDIGKEVARLQDAAEQAAETLKHEMQNLSVHQHAGELLPILETHQLMLQDPELLAVTQQFIRAKNINAEWALKKCIARFSQAFDGMRDSYLRSRKEDIEHVGKRILECLTDTEAPVTVNKSIMMAQSFSPFDIVLMWRSGVLGFVSVQGGEDSHAMILARGIGMPGLMGVRDLFERTEDGDALIVDAEQGEWVLEPDQADYRHYEQVQKAWLKKAQDLKQYAQQPPKLEADYSISLMANLEVVEEIELANQYGVDGVGLFRTEFLFMQSNVLPSEEEQTQYYKQIIQGMCGKPITFRLLDVGADKLTQIEGLLGGYTGDNPTLGLRGVRMLLHKPEVLETQLKAIVRCASGTSVSILVPMVISAKEIQAVRKVLDRVKEELGVSVPIALGCMIEVPAAAFVADELAEASDFFSIGSNDLVQYSLAVDRADEQVGYLYDPSHPAIRGLIQMAVDAAHQHRIPVTVCGELAASTVWTQVFLDMKVSGLSMTSYHVPSIRKQLHDLQVKA